MGAAKVRKQLVKYHESGLRGLSVRAERLVTVTCHHELTGPEQGGLFTREAADVKKVDMVLLNN